MTLRKKGLTLYLILISLLLFVSSAHAQDKRFTIIHSNDLHSHLLGFSPNIDYSPLITGNDTTRGGFARIAAVIKKIKSTRKNPVLLLDGGDFLMGTLFHMISREQAPGLTLMGKMGYLAVVTGNHEFDLTPDGLTRIINSAAGSGHIPQILLANAVFSKTSSKDDAFQGLFKQGLIKPYMVIVRNGVRIGLFGILGKNAAEVAPFASPLTFGDPITVSRRIVKVLREKEKVDMVICLSHSGIWQDKSKSEDEILAQEVNGIDIIISGHTHTKLEHPLLINNTLIVQTGCYGENLGVLDFTWSGGSIHEADYRLIAIDDTIEGDPEIDSRIKSYITMINNRVLKKHGLNFYQIIAETGFDLTSAEAEANLGNLITDAVRWYVDRYDSKKDDPSTHVALALESIGLIRDSVVKGKSGKIAVSDLFRAFPLGIGMDGSMAYPLVSVYLTAAEMKKALEVTTSIYPGKGSDYFIQLSGLRYRYNPHRMIFDRVTQIEIGDDEHGYTPLDYSNSNKKLYRVIGNFYNATFLKLIGSYTMNILKIVPKDRKGMGIMDLKTARVDINKVTPGIQEAKEWIALMEYVAHFKDTDGDGIPNIPEKYRGTLNRIVAEPSWNPVSLLSGGNWLTWSAFIIFIIAIPLIGAGIYLLVRFIKKRLTDRKSG